MPILDVVRQLNKHVLNPAMIRLAGGKHGSAAVIEHTGRRTGKTYATPVVALPVPDGFIIPLPYGTHVDWLRNVLAARRATIRVRRETYEMSQPEIIDTPTAVSQLSSSRRRTFGGFGIKNFLKIQPAPDSGSH
jgi:deazaflavin-dependent oxidoreductase (nitroreductase family)